MANVRKRAALGQKHEIGNATILLHVEGKIVVGEKERQCHVKFGNVQVRCTLLFPGNFDVKKPRAILLPFSYFIRKWHIENILFTKKNIGGLSAGKFGE